MKRTESICLAPLHEAAGAVAEAGPSEQVRSAGEATRDRSAGARADGGQTPWKQLVVEEPHGMQPDQGQPVGGQPVQGQPVGGQPGREQPNRERPNAEWTAGMRPDRMKADREQGAEARHEVMREEQRIEAQACEQEKTVTQLSPDDVLADGGSMRSTSGSEAPTEREMEQDVMTTNPSIESMESRG